MFELFGTATIQVFFWLGELGCINGFSESPAFQVIWVTHQVLISIPAMT